MANSSGLIPLSTADEAKYLPASSSSASTISSGMVPLSAQEENQYLPTTTSKILNGIEKGIGVVGATGGAKYLPGMAAGFGTGIQNAYNNISPFINREFGTQLQKSSTNLYNALGVPSSMQQGVPGFLNKVAQYAPMAYAPEVEIPSALGLIAKIGNPLDRIVTQAGLGALLSQNPESAAKGFGGVQAAIEGASPAVRLALSPFHGIANLINPINAAKSFGEGLANEVGKVKSTEQQLYAPMHAVGDQNLTDNPQSLFDPENTKLYPLKIRRKVNSFLDSPTIENAHQLQSDMFTVGNKIKPLTYGDEDIKNALEDSRQPILNAISTKLNSLSPQAGDMYDQGRDLHRNVLQKLIPTDFFHNLANGEIESNDPNQIVKEYKKAFPTKSSLPDNYLTNGVNDLNNKIGLGKFLQYSLPMAVGAGIAHAGGAGVIGDVLGAGGGGMFARFEESPMIQNMLQNEGLHNTLKNAGVKTRNSLKYITPSVIGSAINASPSNNKNSLNKQNNLK